ncbi:envelope integrity protein Cei [Nakamurella multipartita]|uniref:envelope integrity protein Cei n=1 Tax=Nakamurella multipartita TaxID=53461 RepID=UPI00019E8B2D|nr:envelope integrity protein Cei [Nakamurella multipartita]HOZ58843.1 envelope integrity protein Cei [Nakamurella multipartita]
MSRESAPDRYRRRHYWPVAIVLIVLFVVGAIIWFPSLRESAADSGACNAPGPAPVTTAPTIRSTAADPTATGDTAAPATPTTPTSTAPPIVTSLGAYADHESLANVRPANPSTILLTVFNASSVRGQAKAVADELRAAGFESMLASGNDPLYPASDLNCVAQIRFGPAGAAAARTVLLVAPCAQLVVDSRVDDSVDLALGGRYIYDSVSSETRDQLKQIKDAATPPAVIEGQTAAAKPLPPIPALPTADCAT